MTLERTCRNPRCWQVSLVDPTQRTCPRCMRAYGPFQIGLDRDPTETTVAETEAQREARFTREQEAYLRQTADTNSRQAATPPQQQEEHP